MQVRLDGHRGTFQLRAAAVPWGRPVGSHSPPSRRQRTVFLGIFANNTLDFAKIEATTRIHFTLPGKKISYKDNSCM